jgi:hypothetical protein
MLNPESIYVLSCTYTLIPCYNEAKGLSLCILSLIVLPLVINSLVLISPWFYILYLQLISFGDEFIGFDFTTVLYPQDIMDNCLKQQQLELANNSWSTYLQFGQLDAVMGALLEMKT